jgi:hypothetical protein
MHAYLWGFSEGHHMHSLALMQNPAIVFKSYFFLEKIMPISG